jgi:hypothetical protein
MQRWLARLSFSLLILAGVFFWQGYQARDDPQQKVNVAMLYAAGGLALGLGLAGVRNRHGIEK